ncbi:uncharacterized protein LOC121869042 isoform X2 [Homarus americanus]|uniref:uncharacterized protein LOC121869042 isoform X2 n=1 Tax=Homarus americanus TaxID=6706 RepID=UPI001C46FC43|nr:uncharacterized protein LOC121869042 isoform X2 [Homarus americanus]
MLVIRICLGYHWSLSIDNTLHLYPVYSYLSTYPVNQGPATRRRPSTMEGYCPACYREYITSREAIVIGCGHAFCRDCLIKLRQSGHGKCPFCHTLPTLLRAPSPAGSVTSMRMDDGVSVRRSSATNRPWQNEIPISTSEQIVNTAQRVTPSTQPFTSQRKLSVPNLSTTSQPLYNGGVQGAGSLRKTQENGSRECVHGDQIDSQLRNMSHKLRERSIDRRDRETKDTKVNELKRRFEQLSYNPPKQLLESKERLDSVSKRGGLHVPQVGERPATSTHSHWSRNSVNEEPNIELVEKPRSNSSSRRQHVSQGDPCTIKTDHRASSSLKRQSSRDRIYGSHGELSKVHTLETRRSCENLYSNNVKSNRNRTDNKTTPSLKQLNSGERIFSSTGDLSKIRALEKRSSRQELYGSREDLYRTKTDVKTTNSLKRFGSREQLLDGNERVPKGHCVETAGFIARLSSHPQLHGSREELYRTAGSKPSTAVTAHDNNKAQLFRLKSHDQLTLAADQQEGRPDTVAAGVYAARPVSIVEGHSHQPHYLDDADRGTQDMLTTLHKQREDSYATIISLKDKLSQESKAKNDLELKVLNIQENITELQSLLEHHKEDKLKWKKDRMEMVEHISSQNLEINSMKQEITQLKHQLSSADMEETLKQQVKELRSKLRQEQHTWTKERVNKDQEINSLKLKVKDLTNRLQQYKEKVTQKSSSEGLMAEREREISSLKLLLEEKEEKIMQYKSASLAAVSEVPVGLPNLGNTCYINSVIQCLFNIQTFSLYFTSEQYKKDLNTESDQKGQVALALAQVFSALVSGIDTKLVMTDFKKALETHDEIFQGNDQHEAHDLLSSLLLWLHNDLAKKDNNLHNSLETSTVSTLFQGVKESAIFCRVKNKLVILTEESFDSLSLSVSSTGHCSLQEVMTNHMRPQEIDWECQHCRGIHRCVQYASFIKLPPILALHFSRYNKHSSLKNTQKTRVVFPADHFSLQEHVVDGGYSPAYQLQSVCSHHGMMSYGHYTASCRGREASSSRWWVMDDMEVTATKVEGVLTQRDAHIVFYEAVQDSYV